MKCAKRSCPKTNNRWFVPPALPLLSAFILLLVLAACSADRWAVVASGEYTLERGMESDGADMIRTVQIDRQRQTAVFALSDGSELIVSFIPWERAQWPSGCPANLGSTRMEVLDIVEDPLILGLLTFDDPYLIRNCPPNPLELVLRGGSDFSPSGTACSHKENCLVFEANELLLRQPAP